MYTTLSILKSVKACKPGYSRQISFFGTKSIHKDQRIPLHAIALIGGAADVGWAVTHGIIIDPTEFQRFYERHALSVFKYLCATKISNGYYDTGKHKIVHDLVADSTKVQTHEELSEFLKRARGFHFDHRLFTEVLNHDCWNTPRAFIQLCLEILSSKYSASSKWAFPQADNKSKVRTKFPTSSSTSRSDHDEDDVDEDDVEEVDYNDDDVDEELDDERPARRSVRPSKSALQPAGFWIRSTKENATAGQRAAFLFSEDPYSFLKEVEFKTPKGVSIVKAEDGTISMQMVLSDQEKMFYLVRELNAKTEAAVDHDGSGAEDEDD